MSAPQNHNDQESLMAYLDGELAPAEVAIWEKRLAQDPALRAHLQSLRSTWDALDALQTTTCNASFTTQTLDAVALEVRSRETQEAEPTLRRSAIGSVWRSLLVVFVVLVAAASFFAVRYPISSIDRQSPQDLVVVEDLSTVKGASEEENATAVKDLDSKQQDQEPSVPHMPSLGPDDSKKIVSWMNKVLRERELLQVAPPRIRESIRTAPPFVRRQSLWRILQRNSDLRLPTAVEIERLMPQLSDAPRKQLSQAETVDDKRLLLNEWMRVAINARFVRSEVSTEDP
ncbi:MAG: hypothetical protein O2931_01915 [Planctomycetota bacterium]|nr:hypothetical protein [Planctomycetota bacterium]